jgi:hypothetical protein
MICRHVRAKDTGAVKAPTIGGANHASGHNNRSRHCEFGLSGVDANGKLLIRRKLKRRYVIAFFEKLPPCLVGIKASATSHHWSRELTARSDTPYARLWDARAWNNCLLSPPRLATNACQSPPGRVLPSSALSCVGSTACVGKSWMAGPSPGHDRWMVRESPSKRLVPQSFNIVSIRNA